MMLRQIFVKAVCLVILPILVWAQQHFLRGQIVLVGSNNELTPAEGVEITLREQGDTSRSNFQGLFHMFLSAHFTKGDTITLDVKKEGWRIQYPLDGEVHIPAELNKKVIQVRLLPVRSKKFWSDDRIEKFIQDTVKRAREQIRFEGNPEHIDFSYYISEWAIKYGFSSQEVKKEIDRWVSEVQKEKAEPHKFGLVAYSKKNFGKANKLFIKSAESHIKQLETVRRKEKILIERTVNDFRLAGAAAFNNYAFNKSLIAYQRALNYISRITHPHLWARVSIEIGLSHREIGIRTVGTMVQEHLNAAHSAYRRALEIYTLQETPQGWIIAQNNLATSLRDQGIRIGGDTAPKLLSQAIAAFREALRACSQVELPQQWAATQNNLGDTLRDQGMRTNGEQGQELLSQAVAAHRLALKVYTRDKFPQDWATTHIYLGNVLGDQGSRSEDEGGWELLSQAVTAYQEALKVYTQAKFPQQWAVIQNNLGIVLSDQGHRIKGEIGRELISQAAQAYRQALVVRTQERLPQQWAMTQNNLGVTLREQGMRTEGRKGVELLLQAVAAHRLTLAVYTQEALPQQWAMTQNNLGIALDGLKLREQGRDTLR